MKGPTIADRVIGVVLVLWGLCGAVSSLLNPYFAEMARKSPGMTEQELAELERQMAQITPTMLGISVLLGLAMVIGGIGTLLGSRWGFASAALATGASVLYGAWMMVTQSDQGSPAGLVVSAILLAIYLGLCCYCLSRWLSKPM